MSKKTTEEIKPETVDEGMIVYTDGSCIKGNPGYIGWGYHGYRYLNTPPTKGTGHPTQILTAKGYHPKADKGKVGEVTPVEYYKAFGSTHDLATNNVAELLAAKNAVLKGTEYKLKDFYLKTDSSYVVKGVNEWSASWIKNDWHKKDGTPVPNADIWKSLLLDIETLKSKDTNVNVTWMRSHNDAVVNTTPDVFGNMQADKLAGIASINSSVGRALTEINSEAPNGYWKLDTEKHPMLFNKSLYFNTLKSSQIPGEYYLGNHGTDDELLGRRMSDGAHTVIILKTPDLVIEKLRTYQSSLVGDIDSMIMVKIDKLFSPVVYNDIIDYGLNSLIRPNPKRLDLNALDQEPITKELKPPRIAARALENLSELKHILSSCIDASIKDTTILDITDLLYDKKTTTKKKETTETIEFKTDIKVGATKLEVSAMYNLNGEVVRKPLTLLYGTDLPDRNSLKRLESHQPNVKLLTWNTASGVSRYATLVQTKEDYCICAGMFTNIVYHQP